MRHGRGPATHGIAEQQDRTPLPDQPAAEPVSRFGGTGRSFASAPKSCLALAEFQTSAEPSGVDFPPAIGTVVVCGWRSANAILASWYPSGRFGRRCLAYLLVFQVVLPLLAPIIDISAVYAMVVLNPARAIGVWLAFNALQLITAVYAFRLDRERLRPLWALPLQQVAYRQLLYLVSIQSLTTALLGVGLRWRPMRRAGSFASAPAPGRAR